MLFANVILLNIGLLILYLPRNKLFNFYSNLYLTFSLSTLIVLAARKATRTSEAVIEKMWNLASTTPCLMLRRIATVIKFKGMRNKLMIVDLKWINMNWEVIMIMSPVGAWKYDASQSGQGREVETEAHL